MSASQTAVQAETLPLPTDAPRPTDPAPLPASALDTLFRAARTANAFTDDPVSEDQVRQLYDLVRWGPTALNSQPLRITLIRSAEARQRLLPHLAPPNRDKTAAAPLVAVLSADREFTRHLPTLVPHNPRAADLFADPVQRERSAEFNATLQLGYFILGARAIGLAAGPMTGFDRESLERDLFPDGTEAVLAVVNLGVADPAGYRPRAPRLAYEQVVRTR